jgi:hypothetical protein
MAQWKIAHPYRASAPEFRGSVSFAIIALAATAAVVFVRVIPSPLLLPTLSVVLLTVAGGLALLAWRLRIRRRPDRVDLWDLAGACAFIGFAAGMLSQPEHVLDLFGGAGSAPSRAVS